MSLNPEERHKQARDELSKQRNEKYAYADSLYAREEKNPGSVSQAEWAKLRQMEATSRRLQTKAEKFARAMLHWQFEEEEKARAARREEAAKLLDAGESVAAVAEKMGLSTSTIYKYRRERKAEEDAAAADDAAGRHRMTPSKNPTVAAVGEHAYKPALRAITDDQVWVELIPEPDNPHDPNAISIRYDGNVIGYIPRDRTEKYANNIHRIIASGRTPIAKAKISHGTGDFHEVSLYLLASARGLGSTDNLITKADSYDVPDAYQGTKTGAPIPTPNHPPAPNRTTDSPRRSGAPIPTSVKSAAPKSAAGAPPPCHTGFTDRDLQHEAQRRRLEAEKRERKAQSSTPQSSGCLVVAVLTMCLPLLIFFI